MVEETRKKFLLLFFCLVRVVVLKSGCVGVFRNEFVA